MMKIKRQIETFSLFEEIFLSVLFVFYPKFKNGKKHEVFHSSTNITGFYFFKISPHNLIKTPRN